MYRVIGFCRLEHFFSGGKGIVRLQRLHCFITITRTLGFAHTTRGLRASRPSLDDRVHSLRGYINIPLLIESGHGITLATTKRYFLRSTLTVLRRTRGTGLQTQGVIRRSERLAVNFIPSTRIGLLPGMLPVFHLERPSALVRLIDLVAARRRRGVHHNRLSINLVHRPICDPRVSCLRLFSRPLIIILPISRPLTRRGRVATTRLSNIGFIDASPTCSNSLTPVIGT